MARLSSRPVAPLLLLVCAPGALRFVANVCYKQEVHSFQTRGEDSELARGSFDHSASTVHSGHLRLGRFVHLLVRLAVIYDQLGAGLLGWIVYQSIGYAWGGFYLATVFSMNHTHRPVAEQVCCAVVFFGASLTRGGSA